MTAVTLMIVAATSCSRYRPGVITGDDSCGAVDCHGLSILGSPVPVTGRHGPHVLSAGIDCDTCHDGYRDAPTHKNGVVENSPLLPLVRFRGPGAGSTWISGSDDCATVPCHGVAGTMNWYTGVTGCTVCHVTGNTAGAVDPVTTNGTGTAGKHGTHVAIFRLACTKCHDGYSSNILHINGTLDTGSAGEIITGFDATNPAGSWTGDTGPGTGSCASLACHGADTLAWYGTATWTLPACGGCHGAPVGMRRQVTGAGGDFGANPARRTHHVSGAADPVDAQCRVCHDLGLHMGGTVDLRDPDGTAVIAYDPGDPSSAGPFCLGCHDTDGATATYAAGGSPLGPFNDGVNIGFPNYPLSVTIAGAWAKSYGHGSAARGTGDRLTCLGTGEPGTGCHGSGGAVNGHGSTSDMIAARNFDRSSPPGTGPYDEWLYDLCFHCHGYYPRVMKETVLGVRSGGRYDKPAWLSYSSPGCQSGGCHVSFSPVELPPYDLPGGVATGFADHNDPAGPAALDDPPVVYQVLAYPAVSMGTSDYNLHWLHLGMGIGAYRGNFTLVTCTACHGVHGTGAGVGEVFDELGYTVTVDGSGNRYGTMEAGQYGGSSTLNLFPTYCIMNCHQFTGQTRAWSYPLPE